MSSRDTNELNELARLLREDSDTHQRLVRALVRLLMEEKERERRLGRLRKMDR